MKFQSSLLLKASLLTGLDAVLGGRGFDPASLENELGFEWARFEEDDFLIPSSLMLQILRRVAELTGDNSFIFDMVKNQDASLLGALGFLMESCDNLGQAVGNYIAYQASYNPGVEWDLEYEGDNAYFTLNSGQLYPADKPVVTLLGMSQAWSVLHKIADQQLTLLRVEMSCEPADKMSTYKSFFSAPIMFNAEQDQLIFCKKDLQTPLLQKNKQLYRLLNNHLSENKVEDVSDVVAIVSQLTRQLLLAGHCSIEVLAKLLACDKRTLQRSLKAQGTSYRKLLDKVRFEQAQKYLLQPNISLTQIAMLMAYTDASNFSRAFKKHFGVSPKQWRHEKGVMTMPHFTRLGKIGIPASALSMQ